MATPNLTRLLLCALLAAGWASSCETLAPGSDPTVPSSGSSPAVACGQVVLAAFVTDRARFLPGEVVQLRVDVDDAGATACDATVRLTVTHLGDVVATLDRTISVPASAPQRAVIAWDAPDDDFRGYLAELAVVAPSAAPTAPPLDPDAPGFRTGPVVTTGIDVSSTAIRYPRYGYLSVFPYGQSAETSRAIVEVLTGSSGTQPAGAGGASLAGGDCDDLDPAVSSLAAETWYDGVDGNCDGADDFDQDSDGFALAADCDDADPAVNPAAPEVWYDGVDGDCDGADDFDQDGDGSPSPEDCDDLDLAVFPGAVEEPDGVDSDCDGQDVEEDPRAEAPPADCGCESGDRPRSVWLAGLLLGAFVRSRSGPGRRRPAAA